MKAKASLIHSNGQHYSAPVFDDATVTPETHMAAHARQNVTVDGLVIAATLKVSANGKAHITRTQAQDLEVFHILRRKDDAGDWQRYLRPFTDAWWLTNT